MSTQTSRHHRLCELLLAEIEKDPDGVSGALAASGLQVQGDETAYALPAEALAAAVDRAIDRRRFDELEKLVEQAGLDDDDLEEAWELVAVCRDPNYRNARALEAVIKMLRRGSFRKAAKFAGTFASGEEVLSEFGLAAFALGAICSPWEHLVPVLDPAIGFKRSAPPNHPARQAWATLEKLEFARLLFGSRWRCEDAERETDLLCYRLRFALTWHSGRPFQGVAPYQSIIYYLRTDHPTTAGRILLLWSAGLIWEAIGTPWLGTDLSLTEEARRRLLPARPRTNLATVAPEIRQARNILRVFRPPERPIAEFLDALVPALTVLGADPPLPGRPSIELPPDPSLYAVSEIEPRLIRAVYEPHRFARRELDLPRT